MNLQVKSFFQGEICLEIKGKEVLERLRSARFFDKSNFSALFSNLFCSEKSTEMLIYKKNRADPSRYIPSSNSFNSLPYRTNSQQIYFFSLKRMLMLRSE